MDYLLITNSIRVDKNTYPIVFMAVKSGEGFKRITDIEVFFKGIGGISDSEEGYQPNMEVFAIKRSASVKITVSMRG